MTLEELDQSVREQLEQIAFDAGCRWVEEFRDERGRDPEPEECDEEAAMAAERLSGRVRGVLDRRGITADAGLLAEVRSALAEHFVEALDV